MKGSKLFFLSGFIWELIRLLTFLIITELILNVLQPEREYFFWLLLLSSYGFIIPAGYLLLFFNRKKYISIFHLLRMGKIFCIFSNIVLLFYEMMLKDIHFNSLRDLFFQPFYISPLIFILIFDLIFLFLLLSFNNLDWEIKLKNSDSSSQPDYSNIEVIDKLKED